MTREFMTMNAYGDRLQDSSSFGPGVRLRQLSARIMGRLRLGLRFESTRIGLRRDLTVPFTAPDAKIPVSVRPLTAADLPALLGLDDTASAADTFETGWRSAFAAKHMRGGYVAVDERNGTPCYMQWLFGADDNDFVLSIGGFPALKKDEALLENAFTPVRYRGMGIMPAAMARIAERAADLGARHVITFVQDTNIPSLKGCQRSGFAPHLLHHYVRLGFGFVRRDSFVDLPADDPLRTKTF
jgi:RimJ/RimL family protein N-acetyltransferase